MKKKIWTIILIIVLIIIALNFVPLKYNGFIFRLNFGQVHITDYVGDSKELVIPEKILSFSVVSINGLSEISSAEKITIKANIKNIEGKTLFDCYNLKSITLPKSLEKIDVIDSKTSDSPITTFLYGCRFLESIYVDSENKRFIAIDGVLYNRTYGYIIRCPENKSGKVFIPDWVVKISGIEHGCSPFDKCDKINLVSIPKQLKDFKADLRGYSQEAYNIKFLVRK